MQDPLIHLVRLFSAEIQNGRKLSDILAHTQDELNRELVAEVKAVEAGQPEGVDGVVGESIDVILCMLDMIFQRNPGISDQEILTIAAEKCMKWADKYRDRPGKAA